MHSNTDEDIPSQASMSKIDNLISKSGLGMDKSALDTINFISGSMSHTLQEAQKKSQMSKQFHQSALLDKESILEKEYPNSRLIQAEQVSKSAQQQQTSQQQFMKNHAASSDIFLEQSKKWNTGTIDFHGRMKDKNQESISDYEMQKAINTQRKITVQKKTVKPNLAQTINHVNYDQDTLQYQSNVNKMKESQSRELEELDRMQFESLEEQTRKNESNNQSELKVRQLKAFQDLSLWKGTGLEDEIIKEYHDPIQRKKQAKKQVQLQAPKIVTGASFPTSQSSMQTHLNIESSIGTKKEPLFAKSSQSKKNSKQYMTLDGQVIIEPTIISSSKKFQEESKEVSLSQNIKATQMQKFNKLNQNNKIRDLSRFFILLGTPKQVQQQLLNSMSTNANGKKQGDIRVVQTSPSQLNFYQENKQDKKNMKSQNLSLFSQQKQPSHQIPLVKDWFESLDVQDRVLCLTTIDPQITATIKGMYQNLVKVCSVEQGKFRMYHNKSGHSSYIQIKDKTLKQEKEIVTKQFNYAMSLCNSQAYKSPIEVAHAELELLDYIRITDTFEMHDTLTIKEELVADTQKFYKLAQQIVGSNYLRVPHEVSWIEDENIGLYEFETCAPVWLDMHQPNSLASWILFYLERALFIQHKINVYQQFKDSVDSKNQPIIINTIGKNIILNNELKPFWRNYCEESKEQESDQVESLLSSLRTKAYAEFDIKIDDKQVDSFNGGLSLHSSESSQQASLTVKVEEFITLIKKSIVNQQKDSHPQLNLKDLCMNTLKEACSLSKPNDSKKIAEQYNFTSMLSRAPHTLSANKSAPNMITNVSHIQMKLERLFVDSFRDMINQKLKQQFTTTNKKLQKRKIRLLKKKELEKEKEREDNENKLKESVANNEKITVNNTDAVQMLTGTESIPKTKSDFQNVKDKKKKKKQNKKGKDDGLQAQSEIKEEASKKSSQHEIQVNKQTNDIDVQILPQKPATPKENQVLQINKTDQRQIDPQNYFQMFGQKYAASLESQGQEHYNNSQLSSEISGALPVNPATESCLRAGTTQTISTSEESKKTMDTQVFKVPNMVLSEAENAMSNQEILNLYQQYQSNTLGNARIHNKQWQRKANNVSEMINDLLSEHSSQKNKDQIFEQPTIIDVRVKENKLHAEIDDLGSEIGSPIHIESSQNSSKSSIKPANSIVKFSKRQNQKIIPKVKPSSSDNSSSKSDSDSILLPDLNTNYQPEDNDSSDYDQGCEPHDEDESNDDDSSVALSKSRKLSPKVTQLPQSKGRTPKKQRRAQKNILQNHSKSIKSANPKIDGDQQKINFYPSKFKNEEVIEPETNLIIEQERIINRWTQLKENLPLTCVRIEMQNELNSESQPLKSKQNNKKTKKQRKMEWEAAQLKEEVQVKQIEIIKPTLEVPIVEIIPESKSISTKIDQVSNKDKQNEKKKQKKAVVQPQVPQVTVGTPINPGKNKSASAQAMNLFMQKMHGGQPNPEIEETSHVQKDKFSKDHSTKYQEKKPDQKIAQSDSQGYKAQYQQQDQQQYQKKKEVYQKKQVQGLSNTGKERLSMIEEAKALSTGYHYQIKKPLQTKQNSKQQEQMNEPVKQGKNIIIEEEKKQSVNKPNSNNTESKMRQTNPSAPVKLQKTSGFDLDSKEFQVAKKTQEVQNHPKSLAEAIEGNVPEQQEYKPEKKKNKKTSKRSKKNKQAPNFLVDPNNQNMQDLLQKMNEQFFSMQQKQVADYQQRQQQEAENQLLEDCQPCQEINQEKYYKFFEDLETEMLKKVKEIDQLKDSVRKERQGFVQIVERIVKDTFSNKHGNGYVGIKIFGSMATELAIETSDVDLVVTGINSLNNNNNSYPRDFNSKNQLLRMMQKLYDNLVLQKENGQIFKIKFIQGANVPIIKLVVDLEVINQKQIQIAIERIKKERQELKNKGKISQDDKIEDIDYLQLGLEEKQIDPKVRYLKVDISIDEQSQQYQKYDPNYYNQQLQRNHSGIDTIYHIQELVRYRKDLRPIVMIIKKIFDETFLSMPYYGGISSFSLVLMVSAYLKMFDHDKQQSLSTNLSGFFHFYGVGFKPHQYYLDGDSIEFCEDLNNRPFQDPFIVVDPLDSSNNICHSAFRIRDIQRALVKAFKIINLSCEQYQEETTPHDSSHHNPQQVLERLMTEIREEYLIQQSYDEM